MTPNYYEVLQISRNASPDVIEGAWRALLKVVHPDLPGGDEERAKLINEARDVLGDPARRAEYDLALRAEETARAAEPAAPAVRMPAPESAFRAEPHPSVYYSRGDAGWQAKTGEPSATPVSRGSMEMRERVALTWSMTWPILLIDVVWTLLLHAIVDGDSSTAESAFQAVSFFLLGPLVIQRAMRLGTRQHTIAVRKAGRESGLGIGDALSIFWLLAWRSLILALLALVPLSLLLKAIVPEELNEWVRGIAASPVSNALGLTAVDGIMNMAFVPFLIPAMLRKKYKAFRLELRRRADASQMKSVSPNRRKRNLPKR